MEFRILSASSILFFLFFLLIMEIEFCRERIMGFENKSAWNARHRCTAGKARWKHSRKRTCWMPTHSSPGRGKSIFKIKPLKLDLTIRHHFKKALNERIKK